ncbi:hypothetical protein IW138_005976 [Coemansia sp. RSA 986]|nr:hypothetical protein LPJ74_005961 [Coemansia sp. RSA 1843]KAJ2085990.1 hypothetical protein IW138_005976 [Coemansia sp. RSA 986]
MAVRLAEPIGMTLILPFMYQMVGGFDIVRNPKDISFYASLLLTSFTVCKAATSVHWGILSDRIGRRPVILIGLLGNLLTFVLFGVSKSFTWALVARSLNGLFTGNTIAIKSVIAEISDDTNRPRMMAMLPLMWNLGTMLGGAVGGLFVDPVKKYPWLFGNSALFHEYPYLLPCLVASTASFFGLVVGYFQLEETLVVKPSTVPISGAASETTLLVSEAQSEEGRCAVNIRPSPYSKWDILTPTVIRILVTNAIVCVAVAMHNQLYPIVAATDVVDGGLGMDPQRIGYTLTLCGVFVVFLQLTQYPKLERKYGALACYRRGIWLLVAFSTTLPFLSILAARAGNSVEHLTGFNITKVLSPEFCLFWGFLIIQLYIRMLGDTLAFTSVNLLAVNIAPTKADFGFVNGLQQQIAMSAYMVGTLISGYLWSWSIKHSFPYPFNSHFVWVLGGVSLAASWYMTLPIPDSVNIFASGFNKHSRTTSDNESTNTSS